MTKTFRTPSQRLAIKYRNLYAKAMARVIAIMEDDTVEAEKAQAYLLKKQHRLPWEGK